MFFRTVVALCALFFASCNGSREPALDSQDADAVQPTADGPFAAPSDAQPEASAEASFGALDRWLKDKVEQGTIGGYALLIFDRDDTLLLRSDAGVCGETPACPPGRPKFDVDLVTGVASSSKWVTSTVLLAALDRLVAERKIPSVSAGLDRSAGEVLPCAASLGRTKTVTLRQLLSFTSGLLPDHRCVGDGTSTMRECACAILADSSLVEVASAEAGAPRTTTQPPGSVYKYGSAHQVVAAAIVETATGQPFEALYESLVKGPAGLDARYRDRTLISGSLRASVADYAKFVRAIFHDGEPGATRVLLSKEALDEQERSQTPPGIVFRMSPQEGLDYGLGTWRMCHRTLGPAPLLALDAAAIAGSVDRTCGEVHQQGHGGKGGYQPFIDRKRGIYGVFAMREPSPGAGAEYTPAELGLTAAVRLYAGLAADALRAR
jgi:CubicO group peptidase (beta-lactamase class C family)